MYPSNARLVVSLSCWPGSYGFALTVLYHRKSAPIRKHCQSILAYKYQVYLNFPCSFLFSPLGLFLVAITLFTLLETTRDMYMK